MPAHRILAAAASALLLGCRDATAPIPTDLSGTWAGGHVEVGYSMTLAQAGTALSGAGIVFRNINPPTESLTVEGADSGGHVTLRLLAIDWFLDFDGRVIVRNDSTLMTGTATYMVGSPDTITFVRQ